MSSSSRFFDDSSTGMNQVSSKDVEFTPPTSSPVVDKPVSSLFVEENDDDEEGDDEDDDGYLLFESQIQAIIPTICPSDIQKLHTKHKGIENPVLSAVNDYYDDQQVQVVIPQNTKIEAIPMSSYQSLRNNPIAALNSSPLPSMLDSQRTSSALSSSPLVSKRRKVTVNFKKLPNNVKWRRFIGGLQVVAWATRPTIKGVPYGTNLSIVKNKSTNQSSKRGKQKSVSSYLKLVQDIDNPSAMKEVGRMPEDISSMIYPLVDTGICDFDVTVVFCDGRLSTGDSFIVQLDIYLTSKIFQPKSPTSNYEEDYKQLRTQNKYNGQTVHETPEEIAQRKTQIALVKLFNKLDFKVSSETIEEEYEVIDLENDNDNEISSRLNSRSDAPEHDDEMNLNQLKEFYKRTQTEQLLTSLPETETKDNFKLSLRSYQKQGLTWMLRRERELENNDDGDLINPLWKEFRWPRDKSWRASRDYNNLNEQESSLFYANLYSGEFSLTKPILKSICNGGILADEMGLGKTISTLSLIHNSPFDSEFDKSTAYEKSYAYNTTLIVVPTSLLAQWQEEFTKANNDQSKFLVYYGSEVGEDMRTALCKSDTPPLVVFTTYGTIQNEWAKSIKNLSANSGNGVGLFAVKYFRVVLDEGHNIRNRMNKTTKACYDISAARKWLLTGTPIINRLDDLYSLVKFLQLEPWSNISYWNTFVTRPFEKKNYKQALDVVQAILEPVLLRRTKNMKKNGKPLVELPPKEVVIEKVKFSPKERNLYDWFLKEAETSVNTGIRRGDLLKNYTSILVHILRLRQLCDHMDLIKSGNDEMDEDMKGVKSDLSRVPSELLSKGQTFTPDELANAKAVVLERFKNLDDLECSICTTQPIPFENITFTECGHSFCLSCILEHCDYQELKANQVLCPNCRANISTAKLLKPKKNIFTDENNGSSNYTLQTFDNSLRSSKLNALLGHLRVIRDTTPNEKVVVFSQFSSYLDIMEREFQLENGLRVFKFHGGLSMEKRSEILKQFKQPRQGVTVLLLSLKAGGVGLNLTEASKAFMCDPWWSPSVEDQAIDRIHRIGQNNSVKVVRFIMEGSIEEKMLKIQERKRTIGEAVEAEEEERRKRRVEEIQMLFA